MKFPLERPNFEVYLWGTFEFSNELGSLGQGFIILAYFSNDTSPRKIFFFRLREESKAFHRNLLDEKYLFYYINVF